MTLLASPRLHEMIDAGIITASHDNVNSASIDICLGDTIMVEDLFNDGGPIDIAAKQSPSFVEIKLGPDGYIVRPGQCFLAHSVEFFNLPNTISGQFILRSSVGRCFLEHMQAGWADAGWHGAQLTLEFKNNLEYHDLLIRPGMRIGQMIFFEHDDAGEDTYASKGNYNGQKGPTMAFALEGENNDSNPTSGGNPS